MAITKQTNKQTTTTTKSLIERLCVVHLFYLTTLTLKFFMVTCPIFIVHSGILRERERRAVKGEQENKRWITAVWCGTDTITQVHKSPSVRWVQRRTTKHIFECLGCWVQSFELLWIPCCLPAKQRWRTTTAVLLFAPVVVCTVYNMGTQCHTYSD